MFIIPPNVYKVQLWKNVTTKTRCCKHRTEAFFNGGSDLVTGFANVENPYWNGQLIPTQCPIQNPPCTKHCFEITKGTITDTLCPEIDCQKGDWVQDNSTDSIQIPQCPDCKIFIYYSKRITEDCDLEYKDIRIDSIGRSGLCTNCPPNITIGYIYWYSIHWVLREIGTVDLSNSNCDTNYRVISRSCWGGDELGSNKYYPCNIPACCWGKFRVCKDENGVVNDSLLSYTTDIDSLCDAYITPYPCDYICEEILTPIELGKRFIRFDEKNKNNISDFNSFVSPNPTSYNLDLYLYSSNNKNYSIRIFNSMGNIVYSNEFKMIQMEFVLSVDISEFYNGLYHYLILDKNFVISNGSFIVLK